MAEYDVIIKDGTIIDGTRVPRYRGDIGIKDGKIAKMGRLNTSDAKKVLDARGLIVAPADIDPHAHYDVQICWDPLPALYDQVPNDHKRRCPRKIGNPSPAHRRIKKY